MRQVRVMSGVFLALFVTLAACAPAGADPAPARARDAKTRLEELKRKLQDIVVEWADREEMGHAWFSRVRQIGPDEAKITVVLKEAGSPRNVVTVFLRFYDGLWVTTRYEASWLTIDLTRHRAAEILMVNIDDAAEK